MPSEIGGFSCEGELTLVDEQAQRQLTETQPQAADSASGRNLKQPPTFFSMSPIPVEPLSQQAYEMLRQLEALHILRVVAPETTVASVPATPFVARLIGTLSPKTGQRMLSETAELRDEWERAAVIGSLAAAGHEVVDITLAQVACFAGNMLALEAPAGPLLALSQSAHAALTAAQRTRLSRHTQLLPLPIPTLETIGGSSVRCMLAEVFLPARKRAG